MSIPRHKLHDTAISWKAQFHELGYVGDGKEEEEQNCRYIAQSLVAGQGNKLEAALNRDLKWTEGIQDQQSDKKHNIEREHPNESSIFQSWMLEQVVLQ